jgi:hypothetical protein
MIGCHLSQWTILRGGKPLGTWLDAYAFLMLIDDLDTSMPLYKSVNEVTFTKLRDQQANKLQQAVNQVIELNTNKTKDMIMGQINKNQSPLVFVNSLMIAQLNGALPLNFSAQQL